jgi:hypothetical protein
MKQSLNRSMLLATVAAAFEFAPIVAAPPTVVTVNLGSLPGANFTAANSINAKGQIVGINSCGS